MELLYSIARDTRSRNRPWRKPAAWLAFVLRQFFGRLHQVAFEVFLVFAALDDILRDDLD
jgi:hypothetical protein